jgi:hypothetical protein
LPNGIEVLAKRLRWQAAGCRFLGSPFYGSLLESATTDLETEGPVWEMLEPFAGEDRESAIGLRMLGAIHRLVLLDELPELAKHYPSTGGDGDALRAWPLFRSALTGRSGAVRALIAQGCQTNEVGRSAALLGGFLEVAHRTRLPLRILEIGASAGLNLRWDRYRYEGPDGGWGDPSSPVRFMHSFEVPPPLHRSADVVARKGCDLNPIDPTTEEGALTLRSLVWADQLGRLALLDGALELAKEMPVDVERLNAAEFLERELSGARNDVATVVYHSVFMQYVGAADRQRIRTTIDRAGVFYLAMEPAYPVFEVRLNGELLGTSLAHGTGVRWNVDSTAPR